MKNLILINTDSMGLFPKDKEELNIFELFEGNNLKDKIIRKITFNFNLPLKKYVLNKKWLQIINEAETIILFDTPAAFAILDYIHKMYPNKRLILWYWNPVNRTIYPKKSKRSFIEFWTFDPNDADKFNMKLNTQFYFPEFTNLISRISINNDVFFIGSDKGRKTKLIQLGKKFNQLNIKYFFYLVGYKRNRKNPSYKKPLKYSEAIKYMASSKIILDLRNGPDQTGMSLRPLEALFFKKKLITDNRGIIKSNIYDKNNIFILGKDNLDELPSFLKSRYNTQNYRRYTNYYSFKSWLERFE